METKGLKIRWPHKLLPDSFPDPYYSSKHNTYQKKKNLNNKYAFLPQTQHTLELKQYSKCVFSFEENFSQDLFWYCTKNNNTAADWSSASLGLGSQSCQLTKSACSGQLQVGPPGPQKAYTACCKQQNVQEWGQKEKEGGLLETLSIEAPKYAGDKSWPFCWYNSWEFRHGNITADSDANERSPLHIVLISLGSQEGPQQNGRDIGIKNCPLPPWLKQVATFGSLLFRQCLGVFSLIDPFAIVF